MGIRGWMAGCPEEGMMAELIKELPYGMLLVRLDNGENLTCHRQDFRPIVEDGQPLVDVYNDPIGKHNRVEERKL